MRFLVGTLTEKGGHGVALCTLNQDTLSLAWESAALNEPNWLLLNKEKTRLFSVHEDKTRLTDGYSGYVSELSLTETGFSVLSTSATYGDAPCYLTLSPDERFLYAANYLTGSVAVFSAQKGLSQCVQLIQNHGVGFDKEYRQKSPHMHQISFMPDGTALAVDLGLDALCLYEARDGRLTETERIFVQKGSGARHVVYLNENTLYLSHEMGNLVSLIQKKDGQWQVVQTLSTLPEGFCGFSAAAAIRINLQKTRLYVSNRGHDSLAEYALDEQGLMTLLRFIPCGAFPRDFIVLDDGRFLIANQGSNTPSDAVRRGSLTLLSAQGAPLSTLPLPAAVCIQAL